MELHDKKNQELFIAILISNLIENTLKIPPRHNKKPISKECEEAILKMMRGEL